MVSNRRFSSIAVVLSTALFGLMGCLVTDGDGGSEASTDAGRDTSKDAGTDTTSDEPDDWPPQDLGTPDNPGDTTTDATDNGDQGDGHSPNDPAPDPDAGSGDPLSCSLVNFGYGPIWDGTVDSASTGSEPPPMTGITEAHNAVRRFVGVPDLSWSTALSDSSQTWADYLADQRDCGLVHDPNNDYGENLYAYSSSGALSVTPQDVVGGWSCEREDWDNHAMTCNGVSGFGVSPRVCGHYTQVVWDDTTQVGCAVATCSSGGYNSIVWVCRYAPPGNWVGQRPYGD